MVAVTVSKPTGVYTPDVCGNNVPKGGVSGVANAGADGYGRCGDRASLACRVGRYSIRRAAGIRCLQASAWLRAGRSRYPPGIHLWGFVDRGHLRSGRLRLKRGIPVSCCSTRLSYPAGAGRGIEPLTHRWRRSHIRPTAYRSPAAPALWGFLYPHPVWY